MTQEKKEVAGWWFWIILLVVAALVIFTFVGGGLRLFQKNIETETTRASNQYRTSTEQNLLDAYTQWHELDTKALEYSKDPENQDVVDGLRAQQKALLLRMRKEAARVGRRNVPEDIQNFLDAHSE